MRFSHGAAVTLFLSASATNVAAFTIIQRSPPGLLGKESLLDMVGSYLDNLAKPSYSNAAEPDKKGPKQSYMYTYKSNGSASTNGFKPPQPSGGSYLGNLAEPNGVSTVPTTSSYLKDLKGGAPAAAKPPQMASSTVGSMMSSVSASSASAAQTSAPVTSGNYLDNLSQQPKSFAKPKGGFIYKGPQGSGAKSAKAGVSPGNYLDNLPASSLTGGANTYTPPVVAAAPVTMPVVPEPVAPVAAAPVSSGSYLDAMSGSSAAPASPQKGYMYQKPTEGKKSAPGGYLDNLASSAGSASSPAAPQQPASTSTPPPPQATMAPPQAVQEKPAVPARPSPVAVTSGDYLKSISGSSAPPAKPGGYVYRPPGGYFDRVNPPAAATSTATIAAKPAVAAAVAATPKKTPPLPAPPVADTQLTPSEKEAEEYAIKPLDQWTTAELTLTVLYFLLFIEVVIFADHLSDGGLVTLVATQAAATKTLVDKSK